MDREICWGQLIRPWSLSQDPELWKSELNRTDEIGPESELWTSSEDKALDAQVKM